MGTVTFISDRSDRRAAPREAPAKEGTFPPAAEHMKRALERYRRDLWLMLGRERPSPANIDDVVILDQFRASRARRQFIGDRILRIKTLEAMLELVLEAPEVVMGSVRRRTMW